MTRRYLLGTAMVALLLVGGACSTSSRTTQSAPTLPTASAQAGSTPSSVSTGSQPTSQPQVSAGAEAASVAAVQQDLAGIDSAAAQADTDISAAGAAQAQNDNP